MRTSCLDIDSPEAIPYALEILHSGGLVAFPTDTVYGLGALVHDGEAVKSIYIAKDRPAEKAIPILLSDVWDLDQVVKDVPEFALILAANFWPGALTLVLLKQPDLPEELSTTTGVGVRVPAHQEARRLLKATKSLAVTSANISGKPSPTTAHDVQEQLGGRISLILDGGPTPGGIPSTVVDCLGAEPRILRQGPVSLAEIKKVLGVGADFF